MSLRPTRPLPPLAGLGIHAHLIRGNGDRAKQYGVQTWLVWNDEAAWIEHEGIRVDVNPSDLIEAVDSLASFVTAEGHRKLHALTGLLETFAADQRWSAAFDTAVWGEAA